VAGPLTTGVLARVDAEVGVRGAGWSGAVVEPDGVTGCAADAERRTLELHAAATAAPAEAAASSRPRRVSVARRPRSAGLSAGTSARLTFTSSALAW
jgi:hypothetical protein